MVMVLADFAVAKHKACLDVIDDNRPGLAEHIGGHPVRTALLIVSLHGVEAEGEVLGPRREHAPHVARILPPQFTEHRIAEQHVFGVTLRHGFSIQLLECLIKARDQRVVGLAHVGVRAGGIRAR